MLIAVVVENTFAYQTTQTMINIATAGRTPALYTERSTKWVHSILSQTICMTMMPHVPCYVKSRGSEMMMPARNDCPSGWTEEYHGYLMTVRHDHSSVRDFICVDREAEYVPGSQSNQNGALLYLVQGSCRSLPCLPYVDGRELTCAVCTK